MGWVGGGGVGNILTYRLQIWQDIVLIVEYVASSLAKVYDPTLLFFTIGNTTLFAILLHCRLLDFVSYIPSND